MTTSSSQLSHWHAVYKISTVSSPTHELNSENNGYELVNNKFATNKRLSLLMSNLIPENETSLRSTLLAKLNKIETLSAGSEVILVDSLFRDTPAQVYYNIICQTQSNTHGFEMPSTCVFLVSFVVETETGFELFQNDLDSYCESLVLYLEKYMESVDVSEYLKLLDKWYDERICFIERCLDYFSKDLAFLLCASFCSDGVSFDPKIPENVKTDIQKFLECSSLSLLFDEKIVQNSKYLLSLHSSSTLHVTYDPDNNSYSMIYGKNTPFAIDCIRSIEDMKSKTPIKMRQLIESYKIKVIQDINSFQRLLKHAETDFYALYKTFTFTASCGNAYVILRNARMQNSINNELNMKSLLDVLEQFIDKTGGFDVINPKREPSII